MAAVPMISCHFGGKDPLYRTAPAAVYGEINRACGAHGERGDDPVAAARLAQGRRRSR